MSELEIFVVEDDEWYAEFISYTLSLDQDIRVTKFMNGNDCIKNIKLKPDVITIDYRLPDMSGETLLKTIK
jgi:CheY-like chemotaxis protein